MTVVNQPARRHGAAAGRPAGGLDRRELRCWTLLVAGLAYWGDALRLLPREAAVGLPALLHAVLAQGGFSTAAWAMVAAFAWRLPPAGAATLRQVMAALALCLLAAVPLRQVLLPVLLALALPLSAAADRQARALAALLLGLAVEVAWTAPWMAALHVAMGNLDAAVVAGLLRLSGADAGAWGNLVGNATAQVRLEILTPCASSFPLGGVVLAFVATVVFQDRLPRRRDLPWLAVSLLASVALTWVRLAWMGRSEADYLWLHEGGGVTLYALAALALAAAFPLLATRGPQAQQTHRLPA